MRVVFAVQIIIGLYLTVQGLVDARWVYADHVASRRNGKRLLFAAKAVRQEWLMLLVFLAMFAWATIWLVLPRDRFRVEFLRDYGGWVRVSMTLQMLIAAALTAKVVMRRYDRRHLMNVLDADLVSQQPTSSDLKP
jgi:hypothetical protein